MKIETQTIISSSIQAFDKHASRLRNQGWEYIGYPHWVTANQFDSETPNRTVIVATFERVVKE